MKKVLVLAGLILIVPFTAWSASQEKRAPMCDGMDGMRMMHDMKGAGHNPWYRHGVTLMLRNAEKLKLSKEQARQLEDIRANYTKDILRQEAELKIAEVDLDRLLKADDIDLSRTRDGLKKAEGIETEIRYLRLAAFSEARKALTDEQRQSLKKLMERAPGMEEMMGGMMGGGMMGGTSGGKGEGVAAQEKSAGEVKINAAFKNPQAVGGEEELEFEVKLDTHTVDLDAYRLDKSVLLRDESGTAYSPVSAEPSGSGHHREGKIRFKNPGKSGSVELLFKDLAGVKETVFKWELKEGAR